MASLSLYPEFETNLMSNHEVIELLLQLKSAKAHGKSYIKVKPRHLQRTYSARETGVMQELEKHSLTRITNAPAEFLIQF